MKQVQWQQSRVQTAVRWLRLHQSFKRVCLLVSLVLLVGSMVVPSNVALAGPTYSIINDSRGQKTIRVTGSGSVVTLSDIRQGLGTSTTLVRDKGNGVWELHANLLIERDVTLNLSRTTGVQELKLRSQASSASRYDYTSFVYLRTNNGTLSIEDVWIHSWDPSTNTFDTNTTNGRSYILAKDAARLDIRNAHLSYLGSGDSESYGVAWRDTSEAARVTGDVEGSEFDHNYYGIYTFQASHMVFRNNSFHHNIQYGFDPHDFTHHVLVEDNAAFENGNHGFIISRGCNNFVFRRNISYNNNNPDSSRLAHGFMLDPGASSQSPSYNNLLEENHAYDNEGYGLRVLGSINNTIRNNVFERNAQGITVEQGSTGNTVSNNTLRNNRNHGIFVRGGGNNTTITGNTSAENGGIGVYIKSNTNTIEGNTIRDNGSTGVVLTPETTTAAALNDLLLPGSDMQLAAPDPEVLAELVGPVVQATAIRDNLLRNNTIAENTSYGIDLKGAQYTSVEANTITSNGGHGVYLRQGASYNSLVRNTITYNVGYGIRAYGSDVHNNTWSENTIYGNTLGSILVDGGANGNISAPTIAGRQGQDIVGTALPGATIELFVSSDQSAPTFAGRTTVQADGSFRVTIAGDLTTITAIATDATGNSSSLTSDAANQHTLHLPFIVR